MKLKLSLFFLYLSCSLVLLHCKKKQLPQNTTLKTEDITVSKELPFANERIVQIVQKYGSQISPTYEKAVCTELVIQVLEKIQPLTTIDKSRIRIITNEDIQTLLKNNSEIPKGVYYSLIENGSGIPVKNQNEVLEGDLVQFWTETWGHCGIVKSIDPAKKEMELYSSFPSTNGYGIQKFAITEYVYFVRLK